MIHVRHPGHVPLGDVTVEFIRSGNYVVIEQLAHIGHSRDIPGPDRPVRTLGTVARQWQTLHNVGLELQTGLWSPPCDAIIPLGEHGCSRVRIMLRAGVRMTIGDKFGLGLER